MKLYCIYHTRAHVFSIIYNKGHFASNGLQACPYYSKLIDCIDTILIFCVINSVHQNNRFTSIQASVQN